MSSWSPGPSRAWLGILPLIAFISSMGAAQRFSLVEVLSPADARDGGHFGGSLAVDGTTLAVGAPTAPEGGLLAGAVYLFERRGERWVQTARLTASDPDGRDRFGSSVALSGDVLAIAARRQKVDSRRRGAIYVFERRGGEWTEVRKLISETAPGVERPYGQRVLLSGDRLVVQGSEGVDVFRRDGGEWPREAFFERRGAVDLHARALTLLEYDPGSFAPRLTRLRRARAGWVAKDSLPAPAGQCFWAAAVSRAGRRMVVADPTDLECPADRQGRLHVYRRAGKRWQEEGRVQPTLRSSFGVDVGFFGWSVAMGERALLAHAFDETFPYYTGTVYVFERRGREWLELDKLEGERGDDLFGSELLVGDGYFFVGSPGWSGKVLVFKLGV